MLQIAFIRENQESDQALAKRIWMLNCGTEVVEQTRNVVLQGIRQHLSRI
jgi:hypothetical protein